MSTENTLADKDVERLRYIAACLSTHAQKFPVPGHMEAHADFLRCIARQFTTTQTDSAALAGEVERIANRAIEQIESVGSPEPDNARLLRDCKDALEYVDRMHPDCSGYAVRQSLIARIDAALVSKAGE